MPESRPTESRLVVITGVTRGLGRALASGFAARGHVVIGCGRSHPHVCDLAAALPEPHAFFAVDVARDKAVDSFAERIRMTHGTPDLLVNNAALMNRQAPLWEITADEMRDMLDVNVAGVANTIRSFTPWMMQRGSGVIVNMSSGWGRSTSPNVGPYCTTKWAVEGLSRALADDLPDGLASVALNPGIIDTEMLRSAWGDGAASYPSPEEWAERAVPFLLSLDASSNGEALTVPG